MTEGPQLGLGGRGYRQAGGGDDPAGDVTATSGGSESALYAGVEKQGQRTTQLGHKETQGPVLFSLPLQEPIPSPPASNHTAE